MSSMIQRNRGRKSKISAPAKLDFTGRNAVMVVDKKSNRTKKSVKKDCSKCKKMLPVTDSLENSIDILENLSKELIHVGDGSRLFITKDGINRKELATM
ncbi:1941_t:CDS:1, partial [Paraglomus brasilianum]